MYGTLDMELASSPVAKTPENDIIFSTLLAQLPIAVVLAARDGEFELVNRVARNFFDEYRRARGATDPLFALFGEHDAGLEPINWIVGRVLLTGEIVRGEQIEYIDAHNEWRTLSVNATPIADTHGEINHALVTFTDVTETNQAREWAPLIRAISRL